MHSTSARDGLHRGHTLLLDGGRVGTAEYQLGSFASKGGNASYWSIFVIQVGVISENLVCLYGKGNSELVSERVSE